MASPTGRCRHLRWLSTTVTTGQATACPSWTRPVDYAISGLTPKTVSGRRCRHEQAVWASSDSVLGPITGTTLLRTRRVTNQEDAGKSTAWESEAVSSATGTEKPVNLQTLVKSGRYFEACNHVFDTLPMLSQMSSEDQVRFSDVSFLALKEALILVTATCSVHSRYDVRKAIAPLIDFILLTSSDLETFRHCVHHFSFTNKFNIPGSHEVMADSIERVFLELDGERLALAFGYLLGLRRYQSLGRLVSELKEAGQLLEHPAVMKQYCRLLILEGESEAEEAVLRDVLFDVASPTVEMLDLAARVDRYSLLGKFSRRSGLTDHVCWAPKFKPPQNDSSFAAGVISDNSAKPKRIFIGFFGQVRDPDYLEEVIKPQIEGELGDLSSGTGFSFSTGICTWNKPGARPLPREGEAHLLMRHLPIEVQNALIEAGVKYTDSVEQVSYVLPNTISAMTTPNALGDAAAFQAQIGRIFGDESLCRIVNEDEFSVTLNGLGNPPPAIANQLRMWHTIAGVGQVLEELERSDNSRYDLVLLARTDIRVIGNIGSAVSAALQAPGVNDRIFTNHYPFARFADGIPDFMMLGRRNTMDVLFETEEIATRIVRGASNEEKTYQSRLTGHKLGGSVLFANGISLDDEPFHGLQCSLLVPRRSMMRLMPALLADASNSPDSQVRAAIAKLVQAPGTSP
jgi:hypothetical protein